MELLRPLVRRGLVGVDRLYHRARDLEPVGPLLYLHVTKLEGVQLMMSDGSLVQPGAAIGRLHINNVCAASLRAGGRLEAGIRFARLLRKSLTELAARAGSDSRIANLHFFEGVTWFRPHGSAVGFDTEPFPAGLACRWMSHHFRLLIWAFAPAAHEAAMSEVEPRVFRITRRALIENFGSTACATRSSRTRPCFEELPAADTST